MYRIVVSCHGVPESAGAEAADDITNEFAQHRTWHSNALCTWDGSKLTLQAYNDFDKEGLALLDEFSDSISAYIGELFDGSVMVDSVTVVADAA